MGGGTPETKRLMVKTRKRGWNAAHICWHYS